MDIGPTEVLIVLLVIVILFGAKKLPDLARSLGRSSSEFKKGLKEGAADEGRSAPDPPTDPKASDVSPTAGGAPTAPPPVEDRTGETRPEDRPA